MPIRILGIALLFASLCMSATPDYTAQIESWRKASEERLKSDTGWLTVAGLFWLKEGPNTFGSAESNDLVFPASAPKNAGVFVRKGKSIGVKLNPGATALIKGSPVTAVERLTDDTNGKEDVIVIGDLSFWVIDRGSKIGIRLRDKNSQFRREFTHRSWYPVKPALRVEARWEPKPARTVRILNVVNEYEEYQADGEAVFTLNGVEHRVEPVHSGDQLFLIFKDKTAGKATYGAGRFLYADLPKDGKVILDFNKAYNPPCAFTPYATCPLPPKHNQVNVAIEAGELNYGGH
jgi:uncharacterized protein (DUF1684 family)